MLFYLLDLWWVIVVITATSWIVVNTPYILYTLPHVVAVPDSLPFLVKRYETVETVACRPDPVHLYRKFVRKRFVCELVDVLLRVSVQLDHEWSLMSASVRCQNEHFGHVGWNQIKTAFQWKTGLSISWSSGRIGVMVCGLESLCIRSLHNYLAIGLCCLKSILATVR